MKWMFMRWQRGTRYYEVHLHQDLWNEWVLTQVWGRRGTALGRVRDVLCPSYEEGLKKVDAVKKRRMQRGYALVSERS